MSNSPCRMNMQNVPYLHWMFIDFLRIFTGFNVCFSLKIRKNPFLRLVSITQTKLSLPLIAFYGNPWIAVNYPVVKTQYFRWKPFCFVHVSHKSTKEWGECGRLTASSPLFWQVGRQRFVTLQHIEPSLHKTCTPSVAKLNQNRKIAIMWPTIDGRPCISL